MVHSPEGLPEETLDGDHGEAIWSLHPALSLPYSTQ